MREWFLFNSKWAICHQDGNKLRIAKIMMILLNSVSSPTPTRTQIISMCEYEKNKNIY
jgi:hypothetical protein